MEEKYQTIEKTIQTSSYLHIDATGHKSKGKRGWAWIFTSKHDSLLKLSSSRGKQVLADRVGEYGGYVISDRYGVYNYFQEEKRRICWSHLAKDYERFAHSMHAGLAEKGNRFSNHS